MRPSIITARLRRLAAVVFLSLLLTQCTAGKRWTYHYKNGRTAVMVQDMAVPPGNIPETVMRAIAAGNSIRTKPYVWGGGHAHGEDRGYDCSGAVSYVLRNAGLTKDSMASNELRHFGRSGEGDWITVYAKRGHAFIVVAGLRLDTQGDNGPRWTRESRSISGFRARHPAGL